MTVDELELFPSAPARWTDPKTSHDAAASITREQIRRSQIAVLDVLRLAPATDEALVARYVGLCRDPDLDLPRQSPSGIRTRRNELVRAGLVYDTGNRDRLRSGRFAIVWAVPT